MSGNTGSERKLAGTEVLEHASKINDEAKALYCEVCTVVNGIAGASDSAKEPSATSPEAVSGIYGHTRTYLESISTYLSQIATQIRRL